MVQYNIDPDWEDSFNEWYNIHALHVLKTHGYRWCRRYVAIHGDVRYLTLYMVETAEAYQQILAHDIQKRLPLMKEDDLAQQMVKGRHHFSSNVYEQIGGSNLGKPLLTEDHPIFLVVSDGPSTDQEAEWNRWYDDIHLPAVLRDPWRVMAARFRAVDGAVPARYPLGARYIAIYELLGEEALPHVLDAREWSPALREENESPATVKYTSMMRNHTRYCYKPISKHWAF